MYQGVYHDGLVTPSLFNAFQTSSGGPGAVAQISGIGKAVVSVTPAAVSANTTVEQSVTVAGVQVGDWVEVVPPSLTNGVVLCNARVSAANTVQLQWANSTAGSLTPPSGSYIFLVVR